jgi:3-oxoacyl-[acyl-carrier protein] reductase
MECRLDGRVALITGGSRGLGKAMAETFSAAGADVVIVARRSEALEEARIKIVASTAGQIATCAADVGTPEGCQAAFDAAVTAFGHVDILVNNAGSSMTGPFLDCDDARWQQDLDLKLFGAIRMSRLAIPGMQQRKWGRVLNVLSSGARTPRAGASPTQVSRGAGFSLTKILANEFAPDNILVNALMTGNIVSDQISRRHQRTAPDISLDAFIEQHGKRIPLGRMGTAQEFANMACFLASESGSYIAGAAINIDGSLSPVS